MPARVGQRLVARLIDVAIEEEAGERKTGVEILGRRLRARRRAEKRRQREQPLAPRLARDARHRAARLRRHVDEVGRRAGRRAGSRAGARRERADHRGRSDDGARPRTAAADVEHAAVADAALSGWKRISDGPTAVAAA